MYRQDTLNQNKNVIKSRVAEDFFSLFLKSAKLRKSGKGIAANHLSI
jgi:hypothetical protein